MQFGRSSVSALYHFIFIIYDLSIPRYNLPVYESLCLHVSASLSYIQRAEHQILHAEATASLWLGTVLPEEVLQISPGQEFQDYETVKKL